MAKVKLSESLAVENYNEYDQNQLMRTVWKKIIKEEFGEDSPMYRFSLTPAFRTLDKIGLKFLKGRKDVGELNPNNLEKAQDQIVNSDSYKLPYSHRYFWFRSNGAFACYTAKPCPFPCDIDDLEGSYDIKTRKNDKGEDELVFDIDETVHHVGGGDDDYKRLSSQQVVFNSDGIWTQLSIDKPIYSGDYPRLYEIYQIKRNTESLRGFYTLQIEKQIRKSGGDSNPEITPYTIMMPEIDDPLGFPDVNTIRKAIKAVEDKQEEQIIDDKTLAGRFDADCKKDAEFKKASKTMIWSKDYIHE